MYHEERKMKYLEQLARNKSNALARSSKSMFITFEELEQRTDTDIAEMPGKEIMSYAVSELGYMSKYSANTLVNVINRYKEWCEENGIRTSGERASVSDFDVGKIAETLREHVFGSAREMLDELELLFSPTGGYSPFALACLIWCGFTAKEAVELKDEQINTTTGKIFDLNGNAIVKNMDPDIKKALKTYASTNMAFRIKQSPYSNLPLKVNVYPTDTGYFIKPFQSDGEAKKKGPRSASSLSTYLKAERDKYNKENNANLKINVKSIVLSGSLERIRKLEESGIDIRFKTNAGLVHDAWKVTKGEALSAKDIITIYEGLK